MKQCSLQPKGHNLNIKMYSFKEILELFKLSYEFDIDQLKQAKMMVLRMHPDKSRLPPDYFLFYKKAFDIVVDYYNEKQKVNVAVPHNEMKYESDTPDKATYKQVGKTMKELGTEKFQEKFNKLFEENMVKKRDESVNDWFKKNDPLFEFDDVKTTSGLGMAMDSIKTKTAALTHYKGVENMTSRMGNDLYEDDSNSYVSCDPFGKLKFDDLRKVHKDQTVFAVSERDFEKIQKYSSMDHLQRERGMANLTPIEKTHAEQMLAEKEAAIQKAMLAKKHADHLRSLEYAEKNKSVMSSFFRLTM
jgi:hypothetical protein